MVYVHYVSISIAGFMWRTGKISIYQSALISRSLIWKENFSRDTCMPVRKEIWYCRHAVTIGALFFCFFFSQRTAEKKSFSIQVWMHCIWPSIFVRMRLRQYDFIFLRWDIPVIMKLTCGLVIYKARTLQYEQIQIRNVKLIEKFCPHPTQRYSHIRNINRNTII